jgi:hypothetical protein
MVGLLTSFLIPQAVAVLGLLLITLWSFVGHSVEPTSLTIDQFRALAHDLSHKVTLFNDAWDQDPEAEFYGGTTRD